MLKPIAAIFLVTTALMLASCVTPPGEATLAIPSPTQASYPVTKSTVILVHLVTDERVFEQGDGDPMMLSLARENAGGAPADAKARIYARKRAAVGKPIGNVMLADAYTVASVVRDNLVAGFRQAGYRTTTNPAEAGFSSMQVDVHITRFWAWYARSADHDTLDAVIETTLDTGAAPTPIAVGAHGETKTGREDPGSWVEVLNKALADYRAQVGVKFAYLP